MEDNLALSEFGTIPFVNMTQNETLKEINRHHAPPPGGGDEEEDDADGLEETEPGHVLESGRRRALRVVEAVAVPRLVNQPDKDEEDDADVRRGVVEQQPLGTLRLEHDEGEGQDDGESHGKHSADPCRDFNLAIFVTGDCRARAWESTTPHKDILLSYSF